MGNTEDNGIMMMKLISGVIPTWPVFDRKNVATQASYPPPSGLEPGLEQRTKEMLMSYAERKVETRTAKIGPMNTFYPPGLRLDSKYRLYSHLNHVGLLP